MNSLKLNNYLKIPILGLGTWQSKGLDVESAVFEAIKIGYRHIDTAAIYGNEVEVGRAINKAIKELKIKRSEIFVTTKLWNSEHDNVLEAFNNSLKKLNLDYVDLYLMHFPVPQRLSSWKKMEEIYASGKAKSIGVSNFTIRHLDELLKNCKIIPAVNQVEFTPFLYQKELLDYCNKKNIIIEAYSPLCRGKNFDNKILMQIAKKYNKSVPQILIRWCIEKNTVPLPKSVNTNRLNENFDVFNFEIQKADIKKLDLLNNNLRYCWDPSDAP